MSLPTDSLYKFEEVEKNADFLLEKYSLMKHSNELYFDSIYYYYTKNPVPDIGFSFLKKIR